MSVLHQNRLGVMDGVRVTGRITPEFADILSPGALVFIQKLANQFEGRRRELLAKRQERQKEIDAGKLPDFLPET
ncbi:MAG: malate synthase A, partial [Bacillales bacterium]